MTASSGKSKQPHKRVFGLLLLRLPSACCADLAGEQIVQSEISHCENQARKMLAPPLSEYCAVQCRLAPDDASRDGGDVRVSVPRGDGACVLARMDGRGKPGHVPGNQEKRFQELVITRNCLLISLE